MLFYVIPLPQHQKADPYQLRAKVKSLVFGQFFFSSLFLHAGTHKHKHCFLAVELVCQIVIVIRKNLALVRENKNTPLAIFKTPSLNEKKILKDHSHDYFQFYTVERTEGRQRQQLQWHGTMTIGSAIMLTTMLQVLAGAGGSSSLHVGHCPQT